MAHDREDVLLADHADGVLTLTLNRPEARNAIDDELRAALIGQLTAVDPTSVRAVVLRGEGRAFCAGADVSRGVPARGFATVQRMRGSTHRLIEEVMELPVPVVSVVKGACAGFGMALALAADFCVVANDARFVPAFGAVGLAPDGAIAATVARSVGLVWARRLLLLGEHLDGSQAASIGLVHASAPFEELDGVAGDLALRLAEVATASFGLAKGMIYRGTQTDVAALLREERHAQGLLTMTEDHAEAIAAFQEKRAAAFHGR